MPPPPCDHQQPPSQADPEPTDQERPPAQPSAAFQLTLAAQPAALSLIRERLRQWLMAHRWPDVEIEDLVLAASEAAANVVDHAYLHSAPGDIEIAGRITVDSGGTRTAELTVLDRGRWRPAPEQPDNRRRGIPLMVAAVAELAIDGTDHGTRVRMRGRSVGQ
ncbi:MAG: ATP-binding protein [Pseudonocardiales bacterium]|nr:ATP-binding protein [Pseudonocardiales bacterium]